MAEIKAASKQEKDTQDIATHDTLSGAGQLAQGLSSVALPLEGESKWVPVMRMLAFATLGCIILISIVFQFLAGDDSFVGNQQLGMMMAGLVFLLILEYFVFLKIVIPRQANYGRYIVSQDKVQYFPLTALGLGVRENSVDVAISRFLGVTTSRVADRKGRVSFAVFLIHSADKGKTIKLRSFNEPEQAEAFAVRLGSLLRLNVASGITRKARQKSRAL